MDKDLDQRIQTLSQWLYEAKYPVLFTGAGISTESGLPDFRGPDGVWTRRDKGLAPKPMETSWDAVEPNSGHYALVDLQNIGKLRFLISQNVDNLHEQAGSKNVLHLHGLLTEVRSTNDDRLVYDIGYKAINIGDKCEKGHQLRPNIVWFGEAVPAMEDAVEIAATADIFVVVGSSLVVYPAAGLVAYAPSKCPVYVIDPNQISAPTNHKVDFIQEKASVGVQILKEKLLKQTHKN